MDMLPSGTLVDTSGSPWPHLMGNWGTAGPLGCHLSSLPGTYAAATGQDRDPEIVALLTEIRDLLRKLVERGY